MTAKDYPDYPAGLHVRRDTGEPGTVVEQHSEMITVERESGGKVPAPDPLVSPPDGKVFARLSATSFVNSVPAQQLSLRGGQTPRVRDTWPSVSAANRSAAALPKDATSVTRSVR